MQIRQYLHFLLFFIWLSASPLRAASTSDGRTNVPLSLFSLRTTNLCVCVCVSVAIYCLPSCTRHCSARSWNGTENRADSTESTRAYSRRNRKKMRCAVHSAADASYKENSRTTKNPRKQRTQNNERKNTNHDQRLCVCDSVSFAQKTHFQRRKIVITIIRLKWMIWRCLESEKWNAQCTRAGEEENTSKWLICFVWSIQMSKSFKKSNQRNQAHQFHFHINRWFSRCLSTSAHRVAFVQRNQIDHEIVALRNRGD